MKKNKKVFSFLISFFLIILLSFTVFAEKTHFIWTTFSSGELSPLLDGQVNLAKYFTGAKTLTNFLPRTQGPVTNRTGFRYIGATKNSGSETSRLIPFIFSDTQAYMLEFGPLYIRFWRDNEQVFSTHADIKLLLHPEDGIEMDASQSFTDDSASAKTVTAGGNVQMDSAAYKIGNLSIYFDGTNDFISLADSNDWDISASDWTAAGWIKPEKGNNTPQVIWGQDAGATTYQKLTLEKYTGLLLHGNGTDMDNTADDDDSSFNTKTLSKAGYTVLLLKGIDSSFARTSGSTDIYDSSISEKTITNNSSVLINTTTVPYTSGSSYSFSGSNYLSTADHADYSWDNKLFIIDGWFYTSGISATGVILNQGNTNNGIRIYLNGLGTTFNFDVYNAGSNQSIQKTLLVVNTWHSFRVVAISNKYYVYVDDTLVNPGGSTITVNPQDYSGVLTVGADASGSNKFTGFLADIRIIMDSSSITTESESDINRCSLEIDTSDPKFGTGAMRFSGWDGYTHNGSSDFDIGATGSSRIFTIEAQVNPDVVNRPKATIFTLYVDANNWIELYLNNTSVEGGYQADGGTEDTVSGGTVAAGTYSHIALVGDGTNLSLYVDGARVDTTAFTATAGDGIINDASGGSIAIGHFATANRYKGLMDEFKISLNARYSGATYTAPTVEDTSTLHLKFELSNSGSTDSVEDDDDSLNSSAFHHWEVGEDSDGTATTYLFSDGVLVKSKAMTQNPGAALNDLFYIGIDTDGASKDYRGWMDEFVFIKGQTLHTSAFAVPTTTYNAILGTSAVEVTTTYKESDLFQLKFAQSADTLYIAHPDYAPAKLERYSDTSWKLHTINFLPPPLQSEKEDPNIALTLGQATVGAGVAASDAGAGGTLFTSATSGDVGKEIREDGTIGTGRAVIVAVTDANNATVDIFEAFSGTTIAAGTWDFIGSDKSGTLTISGNYGGGQKVNFGEVVTLTSSLDNFTAGDINKFITTDDGTATIIYKIMQFANSKAVTGSAMSTGTYNTDLVLQAGEWELKKSAWAANDYPGALTFFENRLLWGGSPSYLQTIWGSVVDDYENHDPGSSADADAYEFTLAGRQVNKIRWLDASDVLLIGTQGAEWIIGNRGASTPTTPTNVNARIQTSHGSEDVQAVNVGQSVLFLQKGFEKVREMIFNFDIDRHDAPDMTLLAEHITSGGIVEMAFQEDPIPVLWAVRNDGVLLSMTLLREQEVIGWSKHTTDGTFESVGVIPGDSGDELWTIVKRTINGSTVRYVEKLQPVFNDTTLNSTQTFFVDSGIIYNGASTTSITGLSHLEGEEVSVLADGISVGSSGCSGACTVSSGAITLDTAASLVIVGLPYTSTLQTMRIELKDSRGTVQGRSKSINNVVFRLNNAKYFKYGTTPSNILKTVTLTTDTSLFSGDSKQEVLFDDNVPEGYITILNDEPYPLTVTAIIPEVNVPLN